MAGQSYPAHTQGSGLRLPNETRRCHASTRPVERRVEYHHTFHRGFDLSCCFVRMPLASRASRIEENLAKSCADSGATDMCSSKASAWSSRNRPSSP